MMRDNDTHPADFSSNVVVDKQSFLTWIITSLLIYGVLSGLAILLLPFGAFTQYSVIVHSVVGIVSCLPICYVVYLHWRRRNISIVPVVRQVAIMATLLLLVCILTGLVTTFQAAFGTWVVPSIRMAHLVTGLLLGLVLFFHLVPIFLRYRNTSHTARRPARRKFAFTGIATILALFALTYGLAKTDKPLPDFQAFSDDYSWQFDDDRPFWPSQASLSNPPWQTRLHESLQRALDEADYAALQADLANRSLADGGPITALRAAIASVEVTDAQQQRLQEIVSVAESGIKSSGAINPDAMTGSAGCGASGCHETIYNEWLPSAHGFSATDVLFRRVQQVLSDSEGSVNTRLCTGCHDPVALLSGARDGKSQSDHDLVTYEGNSCIVCHSTVTTDVNGNGGYTLKVPERYLFEQEESGVGQFLSHFLIRGYSYQHVETYHRPLYETSEFCAACHKQTPLPGVPTSAGIAQEQNEYDSWREGRWYHEEDEALRINCRECHMPLVDSDDPASGDDDDSYRTPDDGKHRSHRMLGSNMYIPVIQDLPGGQEQADQVIAWLRGEREIPEILYKWVAGPVVEIDIDAPDEIKPGELVDLKLHLSNNKAGHEFPAGLLDVLESWVELTVTDNMGNVLMQLGNEAVASPSLDAPVIYKSDWYDREGLAIDRHKLWEVVGTSYRRVLDSGAEDIVYVPFRCPAMARPRISDSTSEDGQGNRNSDASFSIDDDTITELNITARLLFRKANPEFIALIYDLDTPVEAPVIELNRATHTIKVVSE